MSILTPILAVLLALSFPFRGTIRYDGGAVIPGLKQQTIDFRLYRSVDDAVALWGRRCTVNLQTNGLFVVEVCDAMGTAIPPGSGVEITYPSLDKAIQSVGTDPLYAGFAIVGRGVELKPRARIMPVPSALVAMDAAEAASRFTLTNALTVAKGVSVADNLAVRSGLKAFQIAGTGTMEVGGGLSASNVIVGTKGLSVRGTLSVGRGLTASRIVAGSLSATAASLTNVTAQTAAFDTAPAIANVTPKGMIIMWYGDPKNLPQDWALCDGGTYSGVKTPNLNGLFIVGASKNPAIEKRTYSVGNTGGAPSVQLGVNNLPSHAHSFGDYQLGYTSYDNYDGSEYYTFEHKTTVNHSTAATGGTEHHPNLPSYCAVYYLMKVK